MSEEKKFEVPKLSERTIEVIREFTTGVMRADKRGSDAVVCFAMLKPDTDQPRGRYGFHVAQLDEHDLHATLAYVRLLGGVVQQTRMTMLKLADSYGVPRASIDKEVLDYVAAETKLRHATIALMKKIDDTQEGVGDENFPSP